MKKQLQFDFSIHRENNTIIVKREFEASLNDVWEAWTKPELIDQWWGPKPWKAETKWMDLRDGGHWLYSMSSPDGETGWGKVSYISIKPDESIYAKDGFCDENGKLDPSFPQNYWELKFSETDGTVLVDMLLTFDSPEDIDAHINMGFQEGFTQCLDQLEELLTTSSLDSSQL